MHDFVSKLLPRLLACVEHQDGVETIIDPITLPIPENLPAGTYTLYTGMYQLNTLERLPVTNDTTGENAILLGEITLP